MKKDKKMDGETLGGRLKGYEAEYEREIEPGMHIMARIDGHKFSKFTKGFKKPFDEILSKAMELTTMDLLEEFNAYTGYTQSDEITLVIPSLMTTDKHKGQNTPNWKHSYSGRVQKMSSLIAGFTTMKFNKHLTKLVKEYLEDNVTLLNLKEDFVIEGFHKYARTLQEKEGNAWFDCRVYGVDSDEEAFNSVLWRIRDAEKNSRSMFAQTYISHKKLQKLTGLEQVELCKEKTGNDWHLVDDRYKYGILVKKENYTKTSITPEHFIKGERIPEEETTVQRSRVTSWAQSMTYSDENVKLIMGKIK